MFTYPAPDIILLRLRWYCRYALSDLDLEEMMAERHLSVDHTTIDRWVRPSVISTDKNRACDEAIASLRKEGRLPYIGRLFQVLIA